MYKMIQLGVKKMGFLYTQVVGGNLTRNTTAVYPYGSIGNAPKNSLSLLLNVNGSTEKTINIELSSLKQEALQEGEYLIGNFLLKSTIKFDEEGNIILDSKKVIVKGEMEIEKKTVIKGETEIEKTLKVNESIESSADIKAGGEIENGTGVTLGGHTHEFPYNAGPIPAQGKTVPGIG